MRLSKNIKMNEDKPLSAIAKWRIQKGHYPRRLYFLCTSPFNKCGFEILRGKYINSRYKDCCLLAISKDKKFLIEHIQHIVDRLYNTKEITYESLVCDVGDTLDYD
ncbi:MAG: hypothetical protein ATN34_01100 [Epulopiscium sp. Nele67-Bin002]|nr:MAG: hypothetical protein ATN34_01100 [Epulopiscium sp. Nele67-Bin002]OON91653.1 MAG: hypothetical protein ATN33_00790 [Epulopiscium sp. Nele67-Bin001]